MEINDNQICYRNKDSSKNFGKSGKEFCLFFVDKDAYFVYKDGSTKLAKKDTEDENLFVNNPY